MNTEPLTVQHAWADRCGCDRNDERVTEPHLYGWPEQFAIFRDGWDAAWLDCKPFLKDGETPAECIARNRADADLLLADLAKERLRAEKAEAALAVLFSIAVTVPAGWKFQSADFSVPNSGRVIFMRDAAGQKLWFSLTEEEQDRIPLYVWGEGATFEAAMEDARKNALAAPVSATEASKP